VEGTYDCILFLEENHSSPKITLSWADQTCHRPDCRTKSLSTKLLQVLLVAILVATTTARSHEEFASQVFLFPPNTYVLKQYQGIIIKDEGRKNLDGKLGQEWMGRFSKNILFYSFVGAQFIYQLFLLLVRVIVQY